MQTDIVALDRAPQQPTQRSHGVVVISVVQHETKAAQLLRRVHVLRTRRVGATVVRVAETPAEKLHVVDAAIGRCHDGRVVVVGLPRVADPDVPAPALGIGLQLEPEILIEPMPEGLAARHLAGEAEPRPGALRWDRPDQTRTASRQALAPGQIVHDGLGIGRVITIELPGQLDGADRFAAALGPVA